MSLKNALRSKICQFQQTPNYPLDEFTAWLDTLGVDYAQVLRELDALQVQLDVEAQALRRYGRQLHLVQQEHWCRYCAQVRACCRSRLGLLAEPE